MKRLVEYLVDQTLIVNLVSVVLVIIGLVSMLTLRKESFPNVDFDFLIIRSDYPGASAEDVEKLVTIELERQLKSVDGIEEINGMSGEGYSIITLKIDASYKVDDVLNDVRGAVDSVEKLPSEVEAPHITKATNRQRPIMNYALSSDSAHEWRLREVAKKLRDQIEKIPGVARVGLDGYREEIVDVAVDLDKLHRAELTLGEVAQAISDRNINISAGNIKNDHNETLVRTYKELNDPSIIEKVVVRSNNSGENILLKEIAHVHRSFKDMEKEEKSYGKPAIFLNIQSKENADILQTTDRIKKLVDDYFSINKIKDIHHEVGFDFSFFVKRRLSTLTSSGLQGILLVFLCLFMFMNFRLSLTVSLGAPLAMIASFMFMDMFDITINMISMFGLIMVMGMLVDDAIIVGEQFYQYVEKGLSPREAAKRAATETMIPVAASVFTTIAAYSSLFFMGGIMGKFMWPVPAVVIICLVMSLLECFFGMPNHLAHFVKSKKEKSDKERWYYPMLVNYEKIIRVALRYPKSIVFSFVLMLVGSVFLAKTLRFELFPSDDATKVYINVKAPVGTSLKRTREAIDTITNIVMKRLRPEEEEFIRSSAGWQMGRTGFMRVGSHYGNVAIDLTMQDMRKRTTSEILEEIVKESAKAVPQFEVSSEREAGGPPRGKAINVELSGDSLSELLAMAKEVAHEVGKIEGVLGVDIDFEEGKKQLLIDINEVEARRLGLTNTQIGLEIRKAFEGVVATEIRKTDMDIDVVVRLDKKYRTTDKTLNNLYILNNQGKRIHLSRVAKIHEVPGAFVIRRFDRKRTISVSGDIDIKKITSPKVNAMIKKFLEKKLYNHPNITFILSGENKDTQESVQRLGKSFLISIATMFVILVVMFSSLAQPLIIMSAIPMGIIGVIVTFKILDVSLGFMAMMGVIGLVGVVVNDSIVLVDALNKKLKEPTEYFQAMVEACVSRLRPVVLTTITTMAGLLPLAHSKGGDPFLRPMALSFAYGLGFATTLTLVFVPCLYLLYYQLIQWWEQKAKKKYSTAG